jgi:hypothetical protein
MAVTEEFGEFRSSGVQEFKSSRVRTRTLARTRTRPSGARSFAYRISSPPEMIEIQFMDSNHQRSQSFAGPVGATYWSGRAGMWNFSAQGRNSFRPLGPNAHAFRMGVVCNAHDCKPYFAGLRYGNSGFPMPRCPGDGGTRGNERQYRFPGLKARAIYK